MSDGRKRFALVDALRGLAAVAVMTYHYAGGELHVPLTRALTPWFTGALSHGWVGVHVFFTLSGFVIAYSVGRVPMTWPRALRFVLRRQVRLDPPYWCSLAIGTLIPLYWHWHLPDIPRFVPGPRLLLAHVLYAYDVLGMHPINVVYWSLCIEVQFYLVFVAMLALGRAVPRALPYLLAASAVQSLRWTLSWRFPHAWFMQHWFLFALGALTAWTLDRRVRPWLPVFLSIVFFAAGIRFERLEPIAGAVVSTLLLIAGKRDALHRWGRSAPLQLLGAISYGVYLLHNEVGAQMRWIVGRKIDVTSPLGGVILLVMACSSSICAAWLLRNTVEAWSIAWASRIRWQGAAARPDAIRPISGS